MIKQIKIKSRLGYLSALSLEANGIANRKCVLFMHGFGHHKCETSSLFSKIAHGLYEKDINCFLFDYYGFGDSEGDTKEVSFDTMLVDANTVLNQIQLNAEKIYIVTYGISSTIASYLLEKSSISLLISISPRFDPFPTINKIFPNDTLPETLEVAEYLDNVVFVNYLRSFGADSANMGGYRISQEFIQSFADKKPSEKLFETSVGIYLIHADTDLLLKTKSYQNIINSFKHRILGQADRFFVNAIKQDEIILDIVNKISGD